MPFYRINGMTVHMRGHNLPKPCAAFVLADDGKAQRRCAAMSAFLCDGDDGGGHTCDAPLCEAHAWQLPANKHYCPPHRQAHLYQQAQRGLFTDLVQP